MSLNKFTHIPLLKNDVKFKLKKKWQIITQKHVPKKIISSKNRNKLSLLSPKKSKEKKKKKKKRQCYCPRKKKWTGNVIAQKKKKKLKEGQRCYPGKKEERKKIQLKLTVFA